MDSCLNTFPNLCILIDSDAEFADNTAYNIFFFVEINFENTDQLALEEIIVRPEALHQTASKFWLLKLIVDLLLY